MRARQSFCSCATVLKNPRADPQVTPELAVKVNWPTIATLKLHFHISLVFWPVITVSSSEITALKKLNGNYLCGSFVC